MNTVDLYRPVGLRELNLIAKSDYSQFPPRLKEQPIFYPVLTYEYAELIIKSWNVKEDIANYAGVITKFSVNHEFIQRYKVFIVGGSTLQELWVPSEELAEFNQNIVGKILLVGAYYGENFKGKEIDLDLCESKSPSQLFVEKEGLVKGEKQYLTWLKENINP